MALTVVYEDRMSREEDAELRDCLCACFPSDSEVFSKTRDWHGSSPEWCVICRESGKIIAHVGIVSRRIKVGTMNLFVAGIQNVFVLPQERGRGLSDIVMNEAMRHAKERSDYDCGLLYCVPQLLKVYARCGWREIPKDDILRIDENGAELHLPGKNIAMFHPLRIEDFPSGIIHLMGNDW